MSALSATMSEHYTVAKRNEGLCSSVMRSNSFRRVLHDIDPDQNKWKRSWNPIMRLGWWHTGCSICVSTLASFPSVFEWSESTTKTWNWAGELVRNLSSWRCKRLLSEAPRDASFLAVWIVQLQTALVVKHMPPGTVVNTYAIGLEGSVDLKWALAEWRSIWEHGIMKQPDRAAIFRRDWDHHLSGLRATIPPLCAHRLATTW